MIRFEPVSEPATFDLDCRKRGAAWLVANASAKRPKAFWSKFREALADGFRNLCGYGAMHEAVGTVDHFVSWNEDPKRAYDWSNLRFSSAWINSSKRALPSGTVLDPFEVEDGWFEVLLPSLQLVVTAAVPPSHRARAAAMLDRLHLGHDERIVRQRQQWLRMYREEKLSLAGLEEVAPLIARAIRKQMKEKKKPSKQKTSKKKA